MQQASSIVKLRDPEAFVQRRVGHLCNTFRMYKLRSVIPEAETLAADVKRMRLDLEYVDRRSLWLDLKILFGTFSAVVSGDGAY